MNSDTSTKNVSNSGFPVWLKTLVGVSIFGLLLVAMVVGAGVLERKAKTGPTPLADQPPNKRAEYAVGQRNWPAAAAAYNEMLEADPFDARSMFYLGYALHNQKKFDEARPWYHKASEFFTYRLISHYNLACMSALQNDSDTALDELKVAIDGGFTTRRGIEFDTDFDTVKDDPEFKRLVVLEKQNNKNRRK